MSGPKRGPGRPQQGGSGKPKNKSIATRVHEELRLAIVAEAERSGRSQSAVIESWLEKGQFWAALERRIIAEDDEPPEPPHPMHKRLAPPEPKPKPPASANNPAIWRGSRQ